MYRLVATNMILILKANQLVSQARFFVLDKSPVDATIALAFIHKCAHEFDWKHKIFRAHHKKYTNFFIVVFYSTFMLSEAPGSFWMKDNQTSMNIFGRDLTHSLSLNFSRCILLFLNL